MKVAFVGKGGSGKTTVTALFSRWLAANGSTVLAFDADINQHLFEALGSRDGHPQSLFSNAAVIKKYLRGTNQRIDTLSHMIKTTPPGQGSRLLRADPLRDKLLARLVTNINGVWAAAVGDLDREDLGVRCYHGKSGLVELLLGHMVDTKDQFVFVDLTAGADPFASSILAKVDAILLVVEPSLPSLTVYEQFGKYREPWLPPLFVLGNKVADDTDVAWLEERLGNDLAGALPLSRFVRQEARGETGDIAKLEPAAVSAFGVVLAKLQNLKPDRAAYLRNNQDLHRKNAEKWANTDLGTDLRAQIDPTFSYPQV